MKISGSASQAIGINFRMAIISYNVVKMANLSVYGSHCVNGV
ncbi:MAG: hypothetical protein ACLRSW_08300 [Christensenellaceae bacterium]